MTFYRYEDVQFAGMPYEDAGGGERFGASRLELVCYEFELCKETQGGHWIFALGEKKWVSKTSKKRYAHASKEEAFNAFKKRKQRQISILSARLSRAEKAFKLPMS